VKNITYKVVLALSMIGILISCGTNSVKPTQNNTELVVTYNGKEVHRRGGRYIGEKFLRNRLKQEKETIIIFSADWCKACDLARKAIKQADLKTEVYYLDMDAPWVRELARLMGIKGVPLMLHVGKDGKTIAVRSGPGMIVTYLVINF
jgi:thioredoxin-related protein